MNPMRVGWIGAGHMGLPMATLILKAGHPVCVYSRTAVHRAKLVARGAKEAITIAQCVREADIVFSSISDDAALRDVALRPEGLLAHIKRTAIYADTSTVSHAVSGEVGREAERLGVAYLRLPISGNAASAETGNVTVLASGPETAWQQALPVVRAFSKAQIYLGTADEARSMKLAINLMVVNTAQSLAEALTLGRKLGLPWETMLDTLAQSTIASPWLTIKCGLLKARNFNPTMTSRLILKDIDLMLAAAREVEVPLPLTATTRQMVQTLVGEGHAEEDFMALVELAERQAGLSTGDIVASP